jgi:hypothetical protein
VLAKATSKQVGSVLELATQHWSGKVFIHFHSMWRRKMGHGERREELLELPATPKALSASAMASE